MYKLNLIIYVCNFYKYAGRDMTTGTYVRYEQEQSVYNICYFGAETRQEAQTKTNKGKPKNSNHSCFRSIECCFVASPSRYFLRRLPIAEPSCGEEDTDRCSDRPRNRSLGRELPAF